MKNVYSEIKEVFNVFFLEFNKREQFVEIYVNIDLRL